MAHRSTQQRRSLRRAFQIERLEDRLLMNADDALADVAAISADTAKPTDAAVAADVELPERFQSAAEFEAWLIEAAAAQWGHLFGQTTYFPYSHYWLWDGLVDFDAAGLVVSQTLGTTNDAAGAGVAFSETNVQVEGVDEADRVETDGEYLYILSGRDLVIVDAGIGDELRIASRIELDERPIGMYLSGDRLAIVSGTSGSDYYVDNGIRVMSLLSVDTQTERSAAGPTTTVTVLDITDRTAPTMVQKSRLDGRLVSSCVVDGRLRLVLTSAFNMPAPIARPVEIDSSATSIDGVVMLPPVAIDTSFSALAIDYGYPVSTTQYVYETQEEYLARVKEEIFKSAMPGLQVLGLDGEVTEERALVDATDVYRPEHPLDRTLTTIATFDLASNEAGPAATATVVTGNSAEVYATADSICLFSASPYEYGIGDWQQTTRIHKFDFDPQTHTISLAARGRVNGTLLNQFAADEHEGFLRVVTTPTWGSGQSVFVLQQVGKRLEVVGNVDGLAPGELIYSVRFMGERAFLVTFRKVDPLFAVDLSEPTDPRVLGELKIPGYSDYLQPIDDNHLLAVGRGADESTGLFEELQVSIFSIADLTDPQLVDRHSFGGGRGITTPATGDRWQRGDGDHHAVSLFANAGVFALPIYNTGDAGWWLSGVETPPSLEAGQGGLQVFQIDVAAGFTPLALIQHETLIERSVQIGEHLLAISSGTVTVHPLADPANQLGELSLQPDDGPAAVELAMFQPMEPPTPEVRELSTSPEESQFARRPVGRIGSVATPAAGHRFRHRPSRPVSHRAREAVFSSPDDLLLLGRRQRDVPEELGRAHARRHRNPADEALEQDARRHWLGIGVELAGGLAEPLVGLRG